MDGVTLSWLVSFVVGVALVVALVAAVRLPSREHRTLTSRLRCPCSQRDVVVEFLTPGWRSLEEPMTVVACSAFENPYAVTCEMACVRRKGRADRPAAARSR